ncbi:DUF6452 family protein [Changchengzhania lutea]|uniref:DUF6452 family protein n=1 Tax=Changchengzhania lutea TaxID=2049305 RepID=UPI00115F1B9F|nr:DUF6452 family protein [Changchengzhania lutea]
MKYFKFLLLPGIVLIVGITISCERDDLCPAETPTTPRLIIDVYDANNPESKKNVFGLFIIGVDNDEFLPGYGIVSSNNLILPLRTDVNTTEYILIKEASVNDNDTPDDTSDDFIDGNQDRITINYSREEVYVSRACGYKTIFKNVTLTIVEDGDNWILSRQPVTDNQSVEDETAAHFTISH